MIIQTSTPNLKKSIQFYSSLGFEMIKIGEKHFAKENGAIIEINPERIARPGLKLYADDWSLLVEELVRVTTIFKIENGFILADPSGSWIYLLHEKLDPALLELESSPSDLGNFSGISLESIDPQKSMTIWTLLGFEKDSGDITKGWVSLKHKNGMAVSIMAPNMCPHLFFNPSLTYFNSGQNLKNIAKIKDAGIPFTEEITLFNDAGIVDNVIIQDPGGFGFFIFND